MHPSFERNRRFWSLNHVKPWVGQFRATTANPRGLMRKCGFGRFWRWKLKTHLWFQRFRKILLFFGRNAGISRVFKGWIRRRTCNVDAVWQVRLHYLYVETSVWKSKGMHPCFERNSRFWGLNHVKPWVGQKSPPGPLWGRAWDFILKSTGLGRFSRFELVNAPLI